MHVAAFIGEIQHFKNLEPSYLCTTKWAISPFLSDQVTYDDYCIISLFAEMVLHVGQVPMLVFNKSDLLYR